MTTQTAAKPSEVKWDENGEEIVQGTASAAIVRRVGDEEIDIQVATAKRYPRNITQFKNKALSMATLDEETAASCFYSVPRKGKPIEGPAVRLAEMVASAWGNLRIETRITNEDDHFVYAEGVCWDLETNVAKKAQVRRRITDKYGKKYNDDMIAVTANAAAAIASRNVVFQVVPMAYTRSIYRQARRVAIGDVKTLAAKRAAMMEYFQKMGITPERILAVLEKPSVEDIDINDLATLKGSATAIKDGELDIDSAFPEIATEVPDTNGKKSGFGFDPKKEEQDPATKAEADKQVQALKDAAKVNQPAANPEEAASAAPEEAPVGDEVKAPF